MVISFKNELYIRTYSTTKDQLTKTFSYRQEKGRDVVVPEGFITDYASIPRLFLPLIPKIGRNRKAAVLHDYLYSAKIGRKKADEIFLQAMKDLEVKAWRRFLIYYAVRFFGGSRYGE